MKTATHLESKTRPTSDLTTGEEILELVPQIVKLQRILVPVDFSKASEKALHYAIAFARQFDAKITLLYVHELRPYPVDMTYLSMGIPTEEAAENAARKQLESICSRAVPLEARDRTLLRIGTPFHEICEAAKELDTDVIILSTHGYSGLKHVFMGSTAERVVRHAPCPVLVVREREHEFIPA